MEEKDSTVSGSPADSGSYSPSPVTTYAAQPPPPHPVNMNMIASLGIETPFSATTTTATTVAASGAISAVGQERYGGDLSGKKKRGRPRKYDSAGNLMIRHAPCAPFGASPSPPGFCFSLSSPTSKSSSKKKRGKHFGSGELFAATAGDDFTPHIVTVNTGEDVAGKILSFTQKGIRGICVLSANGAVCNVSIRQQGSVGGILTFEGRFEILSLTGSFMISETNGIRSKTGGLSVSLAGPDGRVIGGAVAGILTAGSPIQIVLGSFIPKEHKRHKRKYNRQPTMSSSIPSSVDAVEDVGTISQTKPDSEIVFGQSNREADNNANGTQNMNASLFNTVWNGTEPVPNQGLSPDINVSVPSE